MKVEPKKTIFDAQKKFSVVAIFILFTVALSLIVFKQTPEDQLTRSEINFLEMMIPHHQQALEMTELVNGRSKDPQIQELAAEISKAQGPEIAEMKNWLLSAGIESTSRSDHMHGMLTQVEMKELRNARGSNFDRLFLEGMIGHHQGAIDMVALAAKSEKLKDLAAEIFSAQKMEISQMRRILLGK